MLGPHAGLWLSLRTLGICHMLAIVPAAFEAEILILTKNMVQWSEISIWNWPGQTMLWAACLSFPPHPFLCCVFIPFFYNSVQFPTRQGPGIPPPLRDLDRRQCRPKLCEFSLWGSSFSSILFPQGHSDKKAGVVQQPSEPLKGHGILWAGAKSLKTRCRCGVASKRGMDGELREEKTHSFPISTSQSTTLPDTQGSHKAVNWEAVQLPSWCAASPMLAQQDQCVMGTAGK